MNKKSKNLPATAAPLEPEGPSALTVHLGEIVFPKGVETLGEKADFLHTYSVEASKRSNGAAILAGWVLSVARSTCAHGQWMTWLAQNVSFGKSTATNYINLYAKTLGKARANARRPIELTVEPTINELESAAHDVDGTALSKLYRSTRIMADGKWGGDRSDKAAENGHRVGRPTKKDEAEVAAEKAASEASIRAELSAEEGRDLVQKLAGWALGADDGFGALSDGELARTVKTLKQVLARAEEIQSAREDAR